MERDASEELAEILPEPEKREQVVELALRAFSFQGPLPPPEMLEHYGELVPDGADRIIRLTEKEQQHRHELEKSDLRHEQKYSMIGLSSGIVVTVLCVVSALAVVLAGYGPIPASIFVSVPLLSAVKSLIDGKTKKQDETNTQPDK